MTTRRRLFVSIAAALVGILLFIYAIRNVGWSNVVRGINDVGWGFVFILVLSGLRFVLRAAAWRLCLPPHARFPLGQACAAYLAGDAVGNLTPLGLLASEPTKVFLIRHRLATREAASSLAVDLVIYSTSAVAMIAIGLVVLLATVPLSLGRREFVVTALVAIVVGVVVGLRVVGGTWKPERGERPPWRARLALVRQSVFTFPGGNPVRLWRVFGLDLLFHVLAVMEVYLILRLLLPDAPTIAQAIIFSALDRAIIIAFKFIPFRAGVDELFSGGMSAFLWPAATPGVVLAVIKKIRSIFWVGVGLILIAAHPSQGAPATDPRENGPAHPI
jgi:hypothetical protein